MWKLTIEPLTTDEKDEIVARIADAEESGELNSTDGYNVSSEPIK